MYWQNASNSNVKEPFVGFRPYFKGTFDHECILHPTRGPLRFILDLLLWCSDELQDALQMRWTYLLATCPGQCPWCSQFPTKALPKHLLYVPQFSHQVRIPEFTLAGPQHGTNCTTVSQALSYRSLLHCADFPWRSSRVRGSRSYSNMCQYRSFSEGGVRPAFSLNIPLA